MKKTLILAVTVIMCLTILAGCAGEVPANTVFTVDDLNNKTIGVQAGTTGEIYAADVEGATVEKYKKGADAVVALKQGKIDTVIIDDEPAKVFVSKNDDLTILEEEFAVEDYAIAVKKGNTELTEKINTALAELQADGTLDSIKANWIGDDTGKTPYTTPEGTQYPNGKLVMATNAEFPPYELLEGDKVVGLDADMAKAICDKMGYELEIENIDFDSIIAAVDTGKADIGVAGMTVTEDRLQNIDFTDSYTTATQVIIVRKK